MIRERIGVVMMSKQEVRRKALKSRDELEEGWRLETSQEIVKRILELELYQRAEIILSYSSIRSEVRTDVLNQMVSEQGKCLYLPRTDPISKQMHFYKVDDLASLKEGYQGILEPDLTSPLEELFSDGKVVSASDGRLLMIMPGAGFDRMGNRMGYGGGYYDRYLCRYGKYVTSLLAVFYEQKLPLIPAEPLDKKPDYIMTQRGLFEVEGQAGTVV